MVSIPACHAGDRGSIPRRGGFFLHLIQLNVLSHWNTEALKGKLSYNNLLQAVQSKCCVYIEPAILWLHCAHEC